jgi:hypothetical protein
MLNITIYDVMEQHISNKEVRKRLDSYKIEQTMQLRRARWLEKISHMRANRGPRKILVPGMDDKQTAKGTATADNLSRTSINHHGPPRPTYGKDE